MLIEQRSILPGTDKQVLIYETTHPYTGRSVCVEVPGESRYYSIGDAPGDLQTDIIYSYGEGNANRELKITEITIESVGEKAIGLVVEHHSSTAYVDFEDCTFTREPITGPTMHGFARIICHYMRGRRIR